MGVHDDDYPVQSAQVCAAAAVTKRKAPREKVKSSTDESEKGTGVCIIVTINVNRILMGVGGVGGCSKGCRRVTEARLRSDGTVGAVVSE